MGKYKLTKVDAFQCTDGKTFVDEKKAAYYQTKIDIIEKVKKSDFSLSFESEIDDIEIGDLGIIIELANIIKSYE